MCCNTSSAVVRVRVCYCWFGLFEGAAAPVFFPPFPPASPPFPILAGPASKYLRVLTSVAKSLPAECLQSLSDFWKAFGPTGTSASRFMGSEFLSRLAGLKFGKVEQYPWVVTAAMKANLLSKDSKLVDGFCRLVTPSMLAQVVSQGNRATVITMEKLMTAGRVICLNVKVGPTVSAKNIGRLDTRLLLHLLKLGKFADTTFVGEKWLEQIGQALFLC